MTLCRNSMAKGANRTLVRAIPPKPNVKEHHMPTIKIEMPTETIESLVAGKTFQVALADLPNATLVKLMTYAGQRLINDRAKGDTDAEKHKAAEAVVAAMKDGSV